jgi:hypothetical protein
VREIDREIERTSKSRQLPKRKRKKEKRERERERGREREVGNYYAMTDEGPRKLFLLSLAVVQCGVC